MIKRLTKVIFKTKKKRPKISQIDVDKIIV